MDLFEHASRIKDPPCPPARIDENLGNNRKGENLRIKTEIWIRENPNIFALYVRFSQELLKEGKKFSVSLLTERIRWECHFRYEEEFKISNDLRAYIARKLAEEIPELQTLLRFKKTRW